MTNGQYTMLRTILGLYLVFWFAIHPLAAQPLVIKLFLGWLLILLLFAPRAQWLTGIVLIAGLIFYPVVTGPAILLLLFSIDPGWIRGKYAGEPDLVLYDGDCGLCHRSVRFLLTEDVRGDKFRFAPLGEASDTIIVRTAKGDEFRRSSAVLYCWERLGGWWRVLAACGKAIPRPVRDSIYNVIARNRKRMFAATCPVIAPELRSRFVDPNVAMPK
jgi:predicted DCC family thiol-disulfide oxidoreductase YuxK